MAPFTFKALIAPDEGEQPVSCTAGATCGIVLRGHRGGRPVRTKMFNARIPTDALRPGDHHRVATITVIDDQAPEFFSAGRRLEFLTRHDVGHGTVSRRVVRLGTLVSHGVRAAEAGRVSTPA